MNLELVPESATVLHEECLEFDFANPPIDPKELAQSLHDIMIKSDGLGLSANQVGLPYKVFVMRTGDEPFAVFNPKNVDISDRELVMKEGCLSFPNLWLHVKRNPEALVSYQVSTGEWVNKQKLEGLKARVFLHEYDHLLGVTFDERCGELSLSLAKKRRAKAVRLKQKLANKIASQALSSSS